MDKKNEFDVVITETLVHYVHVVGAKDIDDAINTVNEEFDNGNISLDENADYSDGDTISYEDYLKNMNPCIDGMEKENPYSDNIVEVTPRGNIVKKGNMKD